MRATDDAKRQADERGEHQRADGENRRIGRALRDEVAHRPVVQQRVPEVEPHRAAEPVAVLRRDRFVQAVTGARLLDGFTTRFDPERAGGVIAGRETGQHERGRRNGDDQQYRHRQASCDVARQWTTAMVSGDHNSGDIVAAGVALTTRDDIARLTRGAAK